MEHFMRSLIPILGIAGAVILPVLVTGWILFTALKGRHAERLELIKQGIAPSSQARAIPSRYRALRNGCLCTGISLGALTGFIICICNGFQDLDFFVILTSSVLFFLGLSYLIFFVITKDRDMKENETENN